MKRVIYFLTFLAVSVTAQDSLTVAQLEPITYTFDVIEGKLTGEGSAFFEQELSKAQFTMIGEYHGSKRISEFTNAIIPILNKNGYKTMALEVGPIVGNLLNDFNGNVSNQLLALHNKYLQKDSDGDVSTSFPFFDSVEDARFLQTAKDNSWTVFGIDQEFYDSFIILADKMYQNLSMSSQKANAKLYNKTIAALKQFYKDDADDKESLLVSLSKSQLYKEFIARMSEVAENKEIIRSLEKSSEIYLLNQQGKWYENNAIRITYMKSRLSKSLSDLDFNLAKDKMLIKMGGNHLCKGFSPLSLYEVGNTLNEIAEYYGN